jgi:hypothetical protein
VHPTDPVDQPAFDEMNVVLLRPFQTLFKRPKRGTKSVGVKTDLHDLTPVVYRVK